MSPVGKFNRLISQHWLTFWSFHLQNWILRHQISMCTRELLVIANGFLIHALLQIEGKRGTTSRWRNWGDMWRRSGRAIRLMHFKHDHTSFTEPLELSSLACRLSCQQELSTWIDFHQQPMAVRWVQFYHWVSQWRTEQQTLRLSLSLNQPACISINSLYLTWLCTMANWPFMGSCC